jgi:CRP/FNR family cyclic AMP-dependent transcriptional regulator
MKFHQLFKSWQDVDEYDAENIIYSAGDPAKVMYFILAGEVNLSLQDKLLATEKAGDIIGEMAIIKSATHCATATAVSEVKLARLSRKQLKQLIKDNNSFSIHVMAAMARRLKIIDQYITKQIPSDDH